MLHTGFARSATLLSLLGAASVAGAASQAPVVSDGMIMLGGDDYWQVQTIDPYVSVCEGSALEACVLDDGVYNVINHSTGERFENVRVPAVAGWTLDGNRISWSGSDYWQVQTIDPYVSVCEGNDLTGCAVNAGAYNIINLSTGERAENVAVGGGGNGGENGGDAFAMKILHINDHHSHLEEDGTTLTLDGMDTDVVYGGFPRVVSKINTLSQSSDSVLKLHAGDAVTGTLFYTLFKGEADAAMMNQVCFDAFALGNHEFDDGDAGLVDFLMDLDDGSCDTDVLAANVVPELGVSPLATNSATDFIQPYSIEQVNSEQVGVIGIDIANKTKNSSNPDDTTEFLDEVETAQRYIDELEAMGIDKIVLLTHYQYRNDIALAQALNGVDVIVGGDSHTLLGEGFEAMGLAPQGPYPTRLTNADGNQVCVVQAWQYSYVVGELDVLFDADGNVLSCAGTPHLLLGDEFARDDETGESVIVEGDALASLQAVIAATPELSIVQPDEAATATLQGYADQTAELSAAVIGTVAEDLCLERIPGQGRSSLCDASETESMGSDIANLVALAFKSQSNTSDLAIQNAGGVRIDIPAGPISIGDAYTLLPFSNTLLEIDMTGAEVVSTLEDALDYALAEEGSTGAYPYASGLRWHIDATQTKGMRFSMVEVKLKGESEWSAIQPDAVYKVVTNDFIAGGQDGYITLGEISDDKKTDTFLDYAQSFVDHVQTTGVIARLPASEYSTQSYINTEGVLQ